MTYAPIPTRNDQSARQAGFTLIELLVVITIMAILTAVILASFNVAKANNRDQKRISDINLIQIALEQYFNQHNSYPTSTSSLVPEYLAALPVPPSSYSSYNYVPLTQTNGSNVCTSYDLWTSLEGTSSYLESAKDFDSASLPTGMYYCDNNSTDPDFGYPVTNPATTNFFYDVTPTL